MIALQAVRPEALAAAASPMTLAEARKLVSAVHRLGVLPERVPHVRRAALEVARARGHLPALRLVAEQASALDPFVKLAFEAPDQRRFETVRIPLERPGRYSVCVSSQVGCALACTFCATGRMGLARNLETWEIVEQVREVDQRLRGVGPARSRAGRPRVHGVVFQGMGEPLANLDRVLEAIGVLTEPSALAIDARAITVSTAGLPAGILRLAREAPRVRLAVSIGHADSATRRQIMPVTRAHSLDEVLDAAAGHARITRLAPLWAITLLEGVNDAREDAVLLARRALEFAAATGVRPRLSVLAYNPDGEGAPYHRSSPERERAFREALHAVGVPTHRRYSGGSDVAAACGQLALRE
ncbi:MAG: radical SAM protein [Sorangiineae bacterium]|nr:radical SAM protein [Polyangiaceae bacterium]MEB2322964.1 radical SAM protein [Sorangiineae bacterium]